MKWFCLRWTDGGKFNEHESEAFSECSVHAEVAMQGIQGGSQQSPLNSNCASVLI